MMKDCAHTRCDSAWKFTGPLQKKDEKMSKEPIEKERLFPTEANLGTSKQDRGGPATSGSATSEPETSKPSGRADPSGEERGPLGGRGSAAAGTHGTETAHAASGLPFERVMHRLEEVVEKLERGELSLEDSIATFEEGMKLSRLGTKQLEEAEHRVQKLVGEAPDASREENGDP